MLSKISARTYAESVVSKMRAEAQAKSTFGDSVPVVGVPISFDELQQMLMKAYCNGYNQRSQEYIDSHLDDFDYECG